MNNHTPSASSLPSGNAKVELGAMHRINIQSNTMPKSSWAFLGFNYRIQIDLINVQLDTIRHMANLVDEARGSLLYAIDRGSDTTHLEKYLEECMLNLERKINERNGLIRQLTKSSILHAYKEFPKKTEDEQPRELLILELAKNLLREGESGSSSDS